MILAPFNLLALPIVLVLWTLDAYLWLIAARVPARLIARDGLSVWPEAVCSLTDPLHDWTGRFLVVIRKRYGPSWLTWLTVIGSLLLIRYLLLFLILRLH